MTIVEAPRAPTADARPAPHFHVGAAQPVDVDAATRAVADLLVALGLDATSEELWDTPRRAATALADLLTPRPFTMTTFPNDEGYDEMVLVRDIGFHSLCAHHLLPFAGVAHVAYVPDERIVGLSKLARVVEHFARRPQTQERLTRQVADAIDSSLAPRGVGVVLEATHSCMSLRGVRAPDAKTVTTATIGAFRDDAATRAEFSARTLSPMH